jgi:hypothetical protein
MATPKWCSTCGTPYEVGQTECEEGAYCVKPTHEDSPSLTDPYNTNPFTNQLPGGVSSGDY